MRISARAHSSKFKLKRCSNLGEGCVPLSTAVLLPLAVSSYCFVGGVASTERKS